jgi:hypothetical protein
MKKKFTPRTQTIINVGENLGKKEPIHTIEYMENSVEASQT